jgi:hypothetical protein
MAELDHLIVAARTLDEGAAWIEERLGVAPVPGGKHASMGTHNRLLGLGHRVYLEVIAIDPGASAPARPRGFELDTPRMQQRLAQGPALIHWVMRTGAIEEDVRRCPEPLEILSLARGDYRWRIGVAADGRIPCGGRSATLIQWEGNRHPADNLPDSGCRLVELDTSAALPKARIATPSGIRELPGGE